MTLSVRHQEVYDPDYPVSIKVGSEFWFEWLESIRSFRYECENGNITVIKDTRNYWTASKKVRGVLRRKRLGVSHSITHQKLRDAVSLLCLDGCWNEHLKQQGSRHKQSNDGCQEQIEILQQRIVDLESQLATVSHKSRRDTETLRSVCACIEKYRAESKDNPRWYFANKLLIELEQKINSNY